MTKYTPLTLEKFKREIEPYKDTLVLVYFEIARLIDVIEEDEEFYWVLDFFEKGIVLTSCLIGWIPLKGKIDDIHYDELIRVWNLNKNERLEVSVKSTLVHNKSHS